MIYPRCLSIILILMCIFDRNYSVNVEELQLLQCNIDILQDAPIKKGEEPADPVIHVHSKHDGHEYTCILPHVEEENVTEADPVYVNNTEIAELLKPMESGPCLRKETDWWTQKLCFGRNIEQYHVTDGRINSYVIILGVYVPDYDESNDIHQNKSIQEKQRYYSQYYVNGTECGYYGSIKTGYLRSTEVRFYCEEGVEDYIFDVEEPDTCIYLIKVHTSRLCSHPAFKPPSTKKEDPVPCHPLLDEKQYDEYMDKLNGV